MDVHIDAGCRHGDDLRPLGDDVHHVDASQCQGDGRHGDGLHGDGHHGDAYHLQSRDGCHQTDTCFHDDGPHAEWNQEETHDIVNKRVE